MTIIVPHDFEIESGDKKYIIEKGDRIQILSESGRYDAYTLNQVHWEDFTSCAVTLMDSKNKEFTIGAFTLKSIEPRTMAVDLILSNGYRMSFDLANLLYIEVGNVGATIHGIVKSTTLPYTLGIKVNLL